MSPSKPSPKKLRAIADGECGVGTHRYQLYRAAWGRVEQATAAGYHLEAITLLESLLADRLESRASYLTGHNEGFRTLGQLVAIFRKHEHVAELRAVVDHVDRWRECRNTALHEMVKFQHGEFPTWAQQTGGLAEIVRDGQACLRSFAALDERERERNGLRAATWPHAFGPPLRVQAPPSAAPELQA